MSVDQVTPSAPQPAPSNSGFAMMLSAIAVILAMCALLAVAFKLNDMHSSESGLSMVNGTAHHSMMGGPGATGNGLGPAAAGSGVEEVNLIVKSDEEHAKLGPEGTWHDAFLPADFSVDPGATVKVTVLNYDEGEHSFTSPMLGLNVTVPAGTPTEPATRTFTFKAPSKTGSYMWFCAKPCDPWAMSHNGYMRGIVRVA